MLDIWKYLDIYIKPLENALHYLTYKTNCIVILTTYAQILLNGKSFIMYEKRIDLSASGWLLHLMHRNYGRSESIIDYNFAWRSFFFVTWFISAPIITKRLVISPFLSIIYCSIGLNIRRCLPGDLLSCFQFLRCKIVQTFLLEIRVLDNR